jgi:NTF2 fold immunity protein
MSGERFSSQELLNRSFTDWQMQILRIALFVLLIAAVAPARNAKDHGYIPDSQTALDIARAELTHVYGKKQIQSEEPLTAELENGIWTVAGTLWCPDGKGGRTNACVGGTAVIKIRQADGHILSIVHYK